MAQKESQHVAIVDRLNEELPNLWCEHDELTGSSHLHVGIYAASCAVSANCASVGEDTG